METQFWRSVWATGALLCCLIGVELSGRVIFSTEDESIAARVYRTMQTRGLNREEGAQQTAGYYEGLLDVSARPKSVSGLLTGIGLVEAGRRDTPFNALRKPDRVQFRRDFLYFESKPNLNVFDLEDPALTFVTNAHGMPDREYAVAKPPRTRRLAILGCSVTRGLGTPFGTTYDALFEEHLNSNHGQTGTTYEVLNFSVGGYRLTQILELARTKPTSFGPDVYVIPLTEIAVGQKWDDHIQQLTVDGIDLKYGFLKDIAAKAGVRATDVPTTLTAKLAPFRTETIRASLSEIRAHVASTGASLVVLLVPTAKRREMLEESFSGVREILKELDIASLDLLEAFSGEPIEHFETKPGNVHPNQAGHRRIFEHLVEKIGSNPQVLQMLIGS
jgi:hypothetical protein